MASLAPLCPLRLTFFLSFGISWVITEFPAQVLASKREEVSGAKRRYDDGLEKVISTEEQVVSAAWDDEGQWTDGLPASKRDLERKSVCLNC